jgi:two-component system sensor histidine kinase HydH
MRAQIRITTLLAPRLPKVDLDWKYMQKAFLNIFHNAFQALADVDENLREVMVSTRTADKGVEVVITDTGSGIAPELQDKIFQVFFSTKRDGTGMGLPTVRRIVEEHDGTLSVLSEVGKGTSFVMHLPCGRAKPGTDGRDPAEPGSRGDPEKKE